MFRLVCNYIHSACNAHVDVPSVTAAAAYDQTTYDPRVWRCRVEQCVFGIADSTVQPGYDALRHS